jgi:hypothetical protein
MKRLGSGHVPDIMFMMDNAPVHKNGDIEKEINRRGYDCYIFHLILLS